MTTLDEQLHEAVPTAIPSVDHETLQRRGRRRRRVTQLATSMAVVVALGGVVGLAGVLANSPQPPDAVDVLGIDSSDHPDCAVVDGAYSTPEACAQSITERVMSEVEAAGSDFERQILADVDVTTTEYDESASRAGTCMQEVLTEALPGVTVRPVLHTSSLGQQYGFEYIIPDDEEAIAPDQVDDAQQRVDQAGCGEQYFSRIHQVWTAQLIATQAG